MVFSGSNTTQGYTTLLCSALDCGNMYGISLYCKGTWGGGDSGVGVSVVIPFQVIQLYSALPWIVAIKIKIFLHIDQNNITFGYLHGFGVGRKK